MEYELKLAEENAINIIADSLQTFFEMPGYFQVLPLFIVAPVG